jgi:hypothetical protein
MPLHHFQNLVYEGEIDIKAEHALRDSTVCAALGI